jgi:hypothetical protein
MIGKRIVLRVLPLLGALLWLGSFPALAQTEQAPVRLIMLNPQGVAASDVPRIRRLYAAAKNRTKAAAGKAVALAKAEAEAVRSFAARRGWKQTGESASRLRRLYAAIKSRAASASGRVLSLTKTEVWSVPREKVEAVKRAAARRGVIMAELGQRWEHVLETVRADLKIDSKQWSLINRVGASKAATGVGLVAAPLPPMVEYALSKDAELGGSARITVRLSDSTVVTLARTSFDIKPDMCVWRGTVVGSGEPATLMWWPGGRMSGTVQHGGKIYSIRHMGNELHAVVEMAESRMPSEHAPLPARVRVSDPGKRDDPLVQQGEANTLRRMVTGTAPSWFRRLGAGKKKQEGGTLVPLTAWLLPFKAKAAKAKTVPSTDDVVIDVMVAYTRKAAGNYTDIKRDLVDLAIEEANESFRLSNLGHVKLRLVHAYETDYVEQGEHFEHLYRMVDKGDGYMEEVHGLRDKYRADVVVLVVDDPAGCGLATRVHAEADEAFAVVHHECAATSYSIAHEIGHIIGARHDLNLDKTMTPFAYGHGFVNGTKWRDIMSYKESCNGCPRVPVWSSPHVLIKGEPAGAPDVDNARVILEQAARVAAFR